MLAQRELSMGLANNRQENQVGRTIPYDRVAIQQGTLPPPLDSTLADLSIQHREPVFPDASEMEAEAKAEAKHSPRLAYLQLVAGAPVPNLPTSSSTLSSDLASESSSPSISPWTTPPTSPILASSSEVVLFTTEYFEVRKSENKGYGAFAIKDIEVGTMVLVEKPLFKGEVVEVYAKLEYLTREELTNYMNLCYWQKLEADPRIARFLTNR